MALSLDKAYRRAILRLNSCLTLATLPRKTFTSGEKLNHRQKILSLAEASDLRSIIEKLRNNIGDTITLEVHRKIPLVVQVKVGIYRDLRL